MKYPEDFKQEVREMLADGLTVSNVAWYLGVSITAIRYIQNPEPIRRANKKYHHANKAKAYAKHRLYRKTHPEQFKGYAQKYSAQKKAADAQKIEEIKARWKAQGM